MDEEVKPSVPFGPGVDSTSERKNFAQKKFNDKQRSFATRSRRELPKELLMQFKKTEREMERDMAKKTKSKIEEIEAKNRVVDIEKLVMMNAESSKRV